MVRPVAASEGASFFFFFIEVRCFIWCRVVIEALNVAYVVLVIGWLVLKGVSARGMRFR